MLNQRVGFEAKIFQQELLSMNELPTMQEITN